MATDLLTRIKQSAVLCDGAMGTLLYAKGIFINRCYDELNMSQPDLIRGIHHEYLQAGAEIIETNTFGGNSFRLARHSMASRVHEINLAGARLAREAAKSFDVWVAGSVGPLGVQIEPLGKTSFEEARTAFRDQIAALVVCGCTASSWSCAIKARASGRRASTASAPRSVSMPSTDPRSSLPPVRGDPSRTVTRVRPSPASSRAATRPAIPAPTTTTCVG